MSHLPLPNTPLILPPATHQQKVIIAARFEIGESIKVDACAGTGKTTTLIHFAQAHREYRILYICFNSKAVSEAAAKFAAFGIHNVISTTVHGLAREMKALYTQAGKFQTRIHLKAIKVELDCNHNMAWRVQSALHRFYQSADPEINESHCIPRKKGQKGESHVGFDDSSDAISAVRTGLLKAARRIWTKTLDLKDPFPISFDGYLKAYQIKNPRLNYDYIMLDESQDSNPLTLSILHEQQSHCRIILVGDQNQSLYGFRDAVNAMERWDSKRTYPLNESFRFGSNIASVANLVLGTFLDPEKTVVGLKASDSLGTIPKHLRHTFIARTNARLIEEALQYVANGKKIHFVGTQSDRNWDPTIPYKFNDVLDAWRLSQNRRGEIRSPYFQNFESYQELQDLAKGQTSGENLDGETVQGDKELESLCRMIDKHKENLPKVVDNIIQACRSPQESAILLTTTHRAKGLEFQRVRMADDFTDTITSDMEIDPETQQPIPGPPRLMIPGEDVDAEEFNILYVAATRAAERLEICPQLEALLEHRHLLPNPELANLVFESEGKYQPSPDEDSYTAATSPANSPQGPRQSSGGSSSSGGSTNQGSGEVVLKIPYDEKDVAKELAMGAGGRLLWTPASKTWRWSHRGGESLPPTLKKYQI